MIGGQRSTLRGAFRTGGCPGLMEPRPPIIATNAVGGGIVFSREERERHLYIVGKSGAGKSTVLFNLAMHDIMAGEGIAVIDPHGGLAEAIIDAIPPERTHEVCYFNVADTEYPVGFNPLARVPRKRHAPAARSAISPRSATYSFSDRRLRSRQMPHHRRPWHVVRATGCHNAKPRHHAAETTGSSSNETTDTDCPRVACAISTRCR
jgi:hypothetical protein